MLSYLARLTLGRFILWCYFFWWIVILFRYFDPRPRLWLTSLGLSLVIGFALYINATASGSSRIRLEPWPTFRLFLIPFCVSSFAALVKDQGFIVIFSPRVEDSAFVLGLCAVLGLFTVLGKRYRLGSGPSGEAGTPDGKARG